MKVKDCMCSGVTCVKPDCSVEDCAKIMGEYHIGCVPVCDGSDTIVGLVTDRDILLRTVACGKDAKTTPISDIMTCQVCSCTPDIDVQEAEKLMSENQIRRLPVIDNNKVVGILTLGDLTTNASVDTQSVCDTMENICSCNHKNAE